MVYLASAYDNHSERKLRIMIACSQCTYVGHKYKCMCMGLVMLLKFQW